MAQNKKNNVQTEKSSNLDRLAQGISDSERKDLLNKVKGTSVPEAEIPGLTQKKKQDIILEEEKRQEFAFKLRREPFYRRFWIWLRSVFSEESIEEIYNESLISELAHDVERHYPDLILYRRKVLYNSFYEKLLLLAKAAEFFKPYLKIFDRNPGAFYVELSKLLMPGVLEQIEADSDPYQYPLSDPLDEDSVKALRQAVLEGLGSIGVENQRDMYQYAQMLCWLGALIKVPFEKMVRRFGTSADQARVCLYNQMKVEVDELAKVMCNYVHIDERLIGAFVLYMQDTADDPGLSESDNNAMKEKNFRSLATSQIAMIEMFVNSVPMEKIAKIVLNNYLYVAQPSGGGEKWFEQFSDAVKKNFERRLKDWRADYEKERLKIRLHDYFSLSAFPLFPFRPWEKVWNAVRLNNALSIGFVNYFVKQHFTEYMTVLKGVSLEGDFSVKKNQKQLSVALDKFELVNNYLDTLTSDLAPSGSYGGEFSVFEGIKTKNENSLSHINMIVAEVDDDCARIIKLFKSMCTELDELVAGFISGKGIPPFGCIVNIGKILRRMGNVSGRLEEMRLNFSYAGSFIQKLQEIEDPDKKN